MAWYDSLLGKPAQNDTIQRFGQQHTGNFNQLLSQTLQGLMSQNSGSGFKPIADQARSQFQQQTIPGLAERFTSMGSGSLSSPAFTSQLGQAGSGLEQGLAAQQAQYGQQQQNSLQNLLSTLFSGQESHLQQRQPGVFESVAPSAIQALLMFLGGGLGSAGGTATSGLGNLFSRSISTPQNTGTFGSNTALNNLSGGI